MKKNILGIVSGVVGAVVGFGAGTFLVKAKKDDDNSKEEKFRNYYNLLNTWLTIKNKNRGLEEYFESNNYKKIGIYGMGELGNRLYEELKDSSVEIVYATDKYANNTFSEIEVIEIEKITNDVDVIVVTAVFAMEFITEELKKYVDVPIISLEDVVYGVDIF